LLNEIKRLGIKYERDLRTNGKKGVIVGIKYNNNTDDDNCN